MACTDFLIPSKQGDYFNGRSMEFALDMDSQVVMQPAGENVQSQAPGNQPGLRWVSKYAFLGVTAINQDTVVDGLNEKGLSFGALLMPTSKYQNVSLNQQSKALAFSLIGRWILGNFSTVAEVKQAIANVRVWQNNIKIGGQVPGLHFAIHDVTGNSLVIEYINGQLNVYDNPYRVLTNYPTFDWHITNIQNYTSLHALNPEPLQYMGKSISFPGQGGGLLGIPGDFTPPSRFIRIFYLKYFAKIPSNPVESVNLALHLLNDVDIARGTVREGSSGAQEDFTKWIVVKDLSRQIIYFRTYDDLNVYKINLNELPLRGGAKYITIPFNQGNPYQNVNSLFAN